MTTILLLIVYVLSTLVSLCFCKITKDTETAALCFIPVINTLIILAFLIVGCFTTFSVIINHLKKPLVDWIEK